MLVIIDKSKADLDYLTEIIENLILQGSAELDPHYEDIFTVKIFDEDTFYHGTSKILGDIIEKMGHICTRKITKIVSSYAVREGIAISKEEMDALEKITEIPDYIYLTGNKDDAIKWAKERAKIDESLPVVFKVIGKDIIETGCQAYLDSRIGIICKLIHDEKAQIVLKGCDCIKAKRVEY